MREPKSSLEKFYEDHFAGVWKRKWTSWFLPGTSPELIEVTGYEGGHISGGIVKVEAVGDEGTRMSFVISPGDTKLMGYKRISDGTAWIP